MPHTTDLQDLPITTAITLAEAARRCGWSRPNTFREHFLGTNESRDRLVVGVDAKGRLLLDEGTVRELVQVLEHERKARGNWRPRNLGRYARRADSDADSDSDGNP